VVRRSSGRSFPVVDLPYRRGGAGGVVGHPEGRPAFLLVLDHEHDPRRSRAKRRRGRGPVGELQALDVAEDVGALVAVGGVAVPQGGDLRPIDRRRAQLVVRRATRIDRDIPPLAPEEQVVAGAACERVVVRAAEQGVSARVAG
jgi:hypothetical protein